MAADYLVSVVIPAYNAELYLRRAIDSVLSQTAATCEIIVVDDGSTDNTPSIIAEYGERIIGIRQENAGPSAARNKGIERACGEWIAFLDADDAWLPSFIQMQVENLRRHPSLVWSYSNYWFIEQKNDSKTPAFELSPFPDDTTVIEDYLTVYARRTIRTSTLVVKKSTLYEGGLFDPERTWGEDTDLFLRIAYRHPQIGYLPTPLAEYYNSVPGSLTGRYCYLAEEVCTLFEKHLVLSRQYYRQQALVRSLSEKVPYWIKVAVANQKYAEATKILRRLGQVIPFTMRLRIRLNIAAAHMRNTLGLDNRV